jgi:hypothetical protein
MVVAMSNARMLWGLALAMTAACSAPVGTTRSIEVPRDSTNTCTSHCRAIGLELNSVVIMANNVGCVCSPAAPAPVPGGPPAPAPTASAAAGGMTAIVLQQQAAAQQQRQQQYQSQSR